MSTDQQQKLAYIAIELARRDELCGLTPDFLIELLIACIKELDDDEGIK